jgi:alanyl-tRNA synthetase
MQTLTCKQIRNKWVEFFTQKCSKTHKLYPSSSLVPDNPTLLLNSAGMVQFVPIFLGNKPAPEIPRAITIQKCARVGGKDSDLENIGRTTRHHSFFEMLGNFSFGDYFKAEVIPWAWAFVTDELKMDPQRLYISVFAGDEINSFDKEAFDLWSQVLTKHFTDPSSRIWKLTRKDNFWGPPGKSGPCGPCSEIYYDLGDHIENHDDRYVEIWNLVFMELEKDEEGVYKPLANKNIDTGAGLERLATILQSVKNSFETDELFSILEATASYTKTQYGLDASKDLFLKIVTDHLRCLSFLIADGIRPSNVGRGYVLRMIIRRAARFLFLLQDKVEPGLYNLVPKVIENYSSVYPELSKEAENIISVCKKEEEQFSKTIANGLSILENKLKDNTNKSLDGDFVFDLYSTYGMPIELTREIALEKGFSIDQDAYENAKEKHSQVSSTGAFDKSVESNAFVAEILKNHGKTEFVGYANLESKSKVLYSSGKKIVLDKSPFYAESGGQVADKGLINNKYQVVNVKNIEGVFVHELLEEFELNNGDIVDSKVNKERRDWTRKHHTACHLLQAALRKILGPQVQQMGSQVGPEYTRFDFNFERGLTKEEIEQVEKQVNDWIQAKLPVTTKVMDIESATKAGALSFFEDKYEDEVRVLFVADEKATASVELCGGTHVSNIAEIEKLVIAQEGSVASGIRRIKMLASTLADEFIQEREEKLAQAKREEAEAEARKAQEKELLKQATKEALARVDEIIKEAKTINDVDVLILDINKFFANGLNADVLKSFVETALAKLENINSQQKVFVLIASAYEDKVTFVSAVSKAALDVYNASDAVKQAAKVCGGGGGGRPNFAQAGAKDASKIEEALKLYQQKAHQ